MIQHTPSRNGKANPNHVFELFASLSNNKATDVRVAITAKCGG